MIKKVDPQWYRKGWTLDIQDMSWVENTKTEVDFVVRELGLRGDERVLDIACGFGRHSLELARRGFEVVGIDITEVYIQEATNQARREELSADFIVMDMRDPTYRSEFDVVLDMGGGIGFLENDEENLKVFDVVAQALRPGGKHFMDTTNAAHAEVTFPSSGWEVGERSLSLAAFDWDAEKRRMIYTGYMHRFGEVLEKPDLDKPGSSIRLYTVEEIEAITLDRGLRVVKTYGAWNADTPASERRGPLLVYSQKS